MARRSLKKNFILNSAYQILLTVTPLLTAPYLSRILGPDQNGVFSYTQSIANYFVLFAMLGMSTYGVRTIALCGNDRTIRTKVFWSAYFSQLLIASISFVLYLLYVVLVHAGDLRCSVLWGMWVLSAALDVSWLLFGCEEFKVPTIRSFITKLASLLIIFCFVKQPEDVWIYVLAIAGSYLVNAILIWPFVNAYVDYYRPKWDEIKRHFLPNLRLFIPVIAVSFYTSLDRIMLGSMSTMTEEGYFQYSEQICRMPLNVITALGTVMMPRMASLMADGENVKAKELLDLSLWLMLACACAFAFGIASVAPEFVPVFFGNGYDKCKILIYIMALIIPIISITNVIGKQYLLPGRQDHKYTISLITGAAINVVLNLTLIPRVASIGTAVATVAAETTILIVQAAYVFRELPLASYFKKTVPFVMIGAAMAVAVRSCARRLTSVYGVNVGVLLAEIGVGALCYLVLALLYCFATKNREFRRLFGKYGFVAPIINLRSRDDE